MELFNTITVHPEIDSKDKKNYGEILNFLKLVVGTGNEAMILKPVWLVVESK